MSNTFQDSEDGDDVVCPLCCEPMDLSDQNFLPCPCGYRVCMWCWHRIKENYTNLCPACRSEYSDDPHAFAAVDKDDVIKNENKKKQRAKQKETDSASAAAAATAARDHQHALHARHHNQHQQHLQHLHREQVAQQQQGRGSGSTSGGASAAANRRDLANMRVVQRNLVYVTGLPSGLDTEEVLRRPENFGQYGRIYKIAVSNTQANVSAHITFAHKEDALACIQATDGFWLEGRQIRANFGTTKYCATFLRNAPCLNPDCLYLHGLGEEEDRFSKEEIQQRSLLAPPIPTGVPTETGGGGPSGTGKRCASPTLPPPVYESPDGSSSRTSLSQGATTAAQKMAGRGAKPAPHSRTGDRLPQAAGTAVPRSGASAAIAWGGAGANGPSAQGAGGQTAAAVLGRKVSGGAPSPAASPHLPANDSARLHEEWPSLADTAAPAPAAANPAQTTGRRSRKKKDKQQGQNLQPQQGSQSQTAQDDSGSPHDVSADSSSPVAVNSPPPGLEQQQTLSQPPGLGPLVTTPASLNLAGTSAQGEGSGRARQSSNLARTTSAGSTGSSSSMFSNPFFSSGGRTDLIATTAPAPPGFGDIATATPVADLPTDAASTSPPHSTLPASPPPSSGALQPMRSLFQERFGGESMFNGGMFSSSAIGGGLFTSTNADSSSSALALEADTPTALTVSSAVPSAPRADEVPASRGADLVADVSSGVAGLLDRSGPNQEKASAVNDSLTYSPPSAQGKPSEPGYDFTEKSSVASPFGAAFGGGHFGGAFGSALFPVTSHHAGVPAQKDKSMADANGPGADLSVDPFANSSGALAAILGVTLPPVDSQSSLASKMRSGMGTSDAHVTHTAQPSNRASRRGPGFLDAGRDFGRDRDGGDQGRDSRSYLRGPEVAGEDSMGSRFAFAHGGIHEVTFSPGRGIPASQPDVRALQGGLGSPPHAGQHHNVQSHAHRPFGGLGQPIVSPSSRDYCMSEGPVLPPQHVHHRHFHHPHQQQQPLPRPPPPQQQQQQQPNQPYSIQNGMAFLQKVLPGVSLSYGVDRHPPAGAGIDQGQSQGQGHGGANASAGGVGWGDNAAGQHVDPAQAFGSSLWTMAPAPNAPRQSQSSRGSYGAW